MAPLQPAAMQLACLAGHQQTHMHTHKNRVPAKLSEATDVHSRYSASVRRALRKGTARDMSNCRGGGGQEEGARNRGRRASTKRGVGTDCLPSTTSKTSRQQPQPYRRQDPLPSRPPTVGCSPRSSCCSGRCQCSCQPDSAFWNMLAPRRPACTTVQPTPVEGRQRGRGTHVCGSAKGRLVAKACVAAAGNLTAPSPAMAGHLRASASIQPVAQAAPEKQRSTASTSSGQPLASLGPPACSGPCDQELPSTAAAVPNHLLQGRKEAPTLQPRLASQTAAHLRHDARRLQRELAQVRLDRVHAVCKLKTQSEHRLVCAVAQAAQ